MKSLIITIVVVVLLASISFFMINKFKPSSDNVVNSNFVRAETSVDVINKYFSISLPKNFETCEFSREIYKDNEVMLAKGNINKDDLNMLKKGLEDYSIINYEDLKNENEEILREASWWDLKNRTVDSYYQRRGTAAKKVSADIAVREIFIVNNNDDTYSLYFLYI